MSEKNTGGPAFPTQTYEYDGPGNVLQYQEQGMTIRDYFAAKAMQGLILLRSYNGTALEMAGEAYDMADSMLKARES